MLFNVNDYVRVKLTDVGREALRKNHEALFRGSKLMPTFRLPEEDEDGWSKWQLWTLMQEFGPHVSNGFNVPFETEIEIVEK